MDFTVLKKKISTFRTEGGKLRNVSDEVLGEIVHAWENWTGTTKDFYSAIGVDRRKAASLLGKAKRLKREGAFDHGDFTEINIDHNVESASIAPCSGIEIVWDNDRIIRFPQVDHLIEFLNRTGEEKKAA